MALVDGHIDVYEALEYQENTVKGKHTAKSGLFLRTFPGRLLLYPAEAATCAMIFFGGDLEDAGIAAICGFATGFADLVVGKLGGHFKEFSILLDIFVGLLTGLIGGLFHNFSADGVCLKAIFLGTLYWFFYGTAFVIGILEIIAGELQTGVTRFIAVSVKTFVLSLGAGIGLMIATSSKASSSWSESKTQCNLIDLNQHWWRIPLYLLCSISVLGQYRAPVVQYWRGLVVMLCAYEVQYQFFKFQSTLHDRNNLDTSTSNILGAMAGVLSASLLCFIVNRMKIFYSARLLQLDEKKNTKIGNVVFNFMKLGVKICECLRIGRHSDFLKLDVQSKITHQYAELLDPTHSRNEIDLSKDEQNLILQTIVGMQELNIWSILMPALYQLVPGSIIANLWFNAIFPTEGDLDSVFSTLMVISTSLSLGLIIGFALVQVVGVATLGLFGSERSHQEKMNSISRLAGMYSSPITIHDDPEPKMKKPEELDSVDVGDDRFGSERSHEEKLDSNSQLAGMYSFPITIHDDPEPKLKKPEELDSVDVGDDRSFPLEYNV